MWNLNDLDPSGDFLNIVDGLETITYYRFDPTTDTYPVGDTMPALCRELSAGMVTLQSGETTSVDLVVHIAKSSIDDLTQSGFLPRRLDKITRTENVGGDSPGDDVTMTYIVQNVRWSTFGTRYRMECTRQRTVPA